MSEMLTAMAKLKRICEANGMLEAVVMILEKAENSEEPARTILRDMSVEVQKAADQKKASGGSEAA